MRRCRHPHPHVRPQSHAPPRARAAAASASGRPRATGLAWPRQEQEINKRSPVLVPVPVQPQLAPPHCNMNDCNTNGCSSHQPPNLQIVSTTRQPPSKPPVSASAMSIWIELGQRGPSAVLGLHPLLSPVYSEVLRSPTAPAILSAARTRSSSMCSPPAQCPIAMPFCSDAAFRSRHLFIVQPTPQMKQPQAHPSRPNPSHPTPSPPQRAACPTIRCVPAFVQCTAR